MKRFFTWLTATPIALAAFVSLAQAQAYPSQDIHIVCAFPAGSGADIFVRWYAERLKTITGRTIVVENKTGATGFIATEHVVRSKPDGYTMIIQGGSSIAANMHLFKSPPVDVGKTLAIAAPLNKQPYMLILDAKSPYKTVAELTAGMKEKGEKASYVTTNAPAKVMGAIYKQVARLKAVEVSYRTASDSTNDMLSGVLDYGLHDPVFSTSQARAGRMRILAVSTGQRTQANPDLPTMAEFGIPMDLLGWFAAMVPAGTPRPVIEQINAWFNAINATEEAKKFLASIGGDPWVTTPDEGQARFLKEIRDWGDYVRTANIEPQG